MHNQRNAKRQLGAFIHCRFFIEEDMASIGGSSFITLRGSINPTGTDVIEITRPGVDGHAFMDMGKHAGKSQMQSIADVSNASGAKAAILAYKALKGTLITVTDDTGQQYTNVLVQEVIATNPKNVKTPVGGLVGGSYLLSANWVLQHTNVP